ncbi:MAG: hypothetical protein U0441_24630 [Polyangiaceae bacterium]
MSALVRSCASCPAAAPSVVRFKTNASCLLSVSTPKPIAKPPAIAVTPRPTPNHTGENEGARRRGALVGAAVTVVNVATGCVVCAAVGALVAIGAAGFGGGFHSMSAPPRALHREDLRSAARSRSR